MKGSRKPTKPYTTANAAEYFQDGGHNGEVEKEPASKSYAERVNSRAPKTTSSPTAKRNQETRAKSNPRAPRTESLAAEGEAARPSLPVPRTMASPAASGQPTGYRKPSAGQRAWKWAA